MKPRFVTAFGVFALTLAAGSVPVWAATAEKWSEFAAPDTGGQIRHVRTAGACGTSNTIPLALYANVRAGGVYKSSDDGATWTPIGFNRSPIFVNHMMVVNFGCSGATPVRELYASTSDGVYKSQNEGNAWTKISSGLVCLDTSFVTYASATNTIYWAGNCDNSGLYKATRTTGFSETWSKVAALGDHRVQDITWDTSTALLLRVASDVGFYKSNDGGASFSPANGTNPNTLPAAGGVDSILWTNTAVGSPLYAAVNGIGVYRTTDDGVNWLPLGGGLPRATTNYGFSCYTPATPASPSTCTGTGHRVLTTVAGYGTYQTTDNGATWTPFALEAALPGNRGGLVRDPRCGTGAPSYCAHLYGRTQAGVFKSTDSGATWTKTSTGLPGGYALQIEWDRVDPGVAYGRFDHLYKTTDGGKTWARIGAGTIVGTVNSVYVAIDNAVYVASDLYGIYKSIDGGATFNEIVSGLPSVRPEFGATLGGDPVNANIVYVGLFGQGAYKSTNGGASWAPINAGLAGEALELRVLQVSDDDGAVYISTNAGLYRSTDQGATWSFINPMGVTTPARSLRRGADPNVLFVALDKRLDNGTPDAMAGVWKSTNAGVSWTQVLSGVVPRNLHLVENGGSTTIYAFTLYGNRPLVKSFDLGATWIDVKGGFNDYFVRSLSFDRNDTLRFALSEWNGLIRHRQGAFGAELNADFLDDVLLRHADGRNYAWLMNGIGMVDAGGFLPSLIGSWTLVGTGDFNGDGYTDLLWRHADGSNLVWLMKNRSLLWSGAIPAAGLNWKVGGIGDFDGDGRDDILWREVSGYNAMYLMTGFSQVGGLQVTQANVAGVGIDWKVGAIADFDLDGRADIMWRNINGANFMFFMNGAEIKAQSAMAGVGADWQPAAVADFNGDGKPDVLWRNIGGANYMWFLDGVAVSSEAAVPGIGNDWTASATGDFDGDGKLDVFWHNVAGWNWIWLMNGAVVKAGSGYTVVPGEPNWSIINR